MAEQKRKEKMEKTIKKSSRVELDEEVVCSEEEENDEEFKVRESSRQQKVDVMGPVSVTADRLNLSCRQMAMSSAATARALGLSVEDTNILVTTAWRKRTESGNVLAVKIKESFVCPELSCLHWDGKTLKMARETKGNFVAIYVTGVEDGQESKLLGIPQAPGGKGAEDFEEIRVVLEDWGIKKQIGPIVFDTTLANTGEWEGFAGKLIFRI